MSLICLTISGCTNFMGAEKHIGGPYNDERWFLNPEYKADGVPSGMAFYGDAAQQIKHKFDIRYYVSGRKERIPENHFWKVKHNGIRFNYQTDENLFIYERTEHGEYVIIERDKNPTAPKGYSGIKESVNKLPVRLCGEVWCLLYPRRFTGEDHYVKRAILYQD
jgi:hypothetical protein